MCASEEETAEDVCPEALQLIGEKGITAAGGDDVVKDGYLTMGEVVCIELNDLRLCDTLLLVMAVLMHGKAVATDADVGKAVCDAAKLAHSLRKHLVSALVLGLGACRNANENHILHSLTELSYEMRCRHLRHLLEGIVTSVLERPNEAACLHCVRTHVLDAYGKILAEPNQLLGQLRLQCIVYHSCHSSLFFFSLCSAGFSCLSEGYFLLSQGRWRHQAKLVTENTLVKRKPKEEDFQTNEVASWPVLRMQAESANFANNIRSDKAERRKR